MGKVVEYVGWMQTLKDRVKEGWTQYWSSGSDSGSEEKETNFREKVKDKLEKLTQRTIRRINRSSTTQDGDFSHLTRTKTSAELVRISAAVMGIEFSYAAETAFVSPLLLNIGLRHRHMTLMWCLSPLLGFFVTPLLGSLSDGCHSRLGKRRPFIILLSIGIILGLILVPNGQSIGRLLGDTYKNYSVVSVKPGTKTASSLSTSAATTAAPFLAPAAPDELQVNFSWIDDGKLQLQPRQRQKQRQEEQDEKRTDSNLSSNNRQLLSFNPIESDLSKTRSRSGHDQSQSNSQPSLSYKHGSQYLHIFDESGRRLNSMGHEDDERDLQDTLKKFKLTESQTTSTNKKETKSDHSLDNLFREAVFEMDQSQSQRQGDEQGEEDNVFKTASLTNSASPSSSTNSGIAMTGPASGISTTTIVNNSSNDSNQNPDEETVTGGSSGENDSIANHPWGLIFTVIGTVLLDFDADACQSPSRAYMLDVTIPEDHARGLSMFTIMAGLGGSMGYCLGALNWENTFIGTFFGGQVRAVFTLVLFIFIGCVITTLRSFQEIPIDRLYHPQKPSDGGEAGRKYARFEEDSDFEENTGKAAPSGYGAIGSVAVAETSFSENKENKAVEKDTGEIGSSEAAVPTFREYVKTIVQMPKSLQWLCLTNYFCWMSLVCYSLYFTDFVGEAVFNGDPTAPPGSVSRINYEDGVRFGCWGMSLYSLSCSAYSLSIDTLIQRFGAKRVYICGQLVYSVGMILMGICRHRAGVLIFSCTAGIMYATLFTMPYILVARYHAAETFDIDVDDLVQKPPLKRGLGTDVAIVSSMVFLAQMTQALTLGTVVSLVGTPTAIVFAAAVFASCGAAVATRVLYLDL